jgi:hypothetical protein
MILPDTRLTNLLINLVSIKSHISQPQRAIFRIYMQDDSLTGSPEDPKLIIIYHTIIYQ